MPAVCHRTDAKGVLIETLKSILEQVIIKRNSLRTGAPFFAGRASIFQPNLKLLSCDTFPVFWGKC